LSPARVGIGCSVILVADRSEMEIEMVLEVGKDDQPEEYNKTHNVEVNRKLWTVFKGNN
jgi:hypothetical protein